MDEYQQGRIVLFNYTPLFEIGFFTYLNDKKFSLINK